MGEWNKKEEGWGKVRRMEEKEENEKLYTGNEEDEEEAEEEWGRRITFPVATDPLGMPSVLDESEHPYHSLCGGKEIDLLIGRGPPINV